MKTIYPILILLILLFSCNYKIQKNLRPPIRTGGPCEYVEYPGVAVIIGFEPFEYGVYSYPKFPYKIIFNFTPDDSLASKKYIYSIWGDSNQKLDINQIIVPSKLSVALKYLKIGNQLYCIRCEETKGTCTPLTFKFPELDSIAREKSE